MANCMDSRRGEAEVNTVPPTGGSENGFRPVLLVDDDPGFREALAAHLERLGCGLEHATDASQLEDLLGRHEPHVLVLSDDGPGVSALDLVSTLRGSARWRHLKIFVVGRRLGPETALRAYGVGADAALSKSRSSTLTELTARVHGEVRRAAEDGSPGDSHDDMAPGGGAADSPGTSDVPDVIVVEDDPTLVEMLSYSLSNQGYELLVFSNGREALDALLAMKTGSRRPVILLDVDLPGLDGFRVLQELSARRPGDFQVIIATQHRSEAAQVLAIESGALDYIVKPVSMPITLAKVERLVQAGASR